MTLLRSFRHLGAALVAALLLASPAVAASRDLDRSFGGDGAVLTPLGGSNAVANGMALQADGKIVVGGAASSPDSEPEAPAGDSFGPALARYLPNGTLDPSFGGGDGTVLDHYSIDGSQIDAVAVQPDGKIVVAGGGNCCVSNLYVARYLPDGSRDPDFGDGGVRGIGLRPDAAHPTALVLQPDGKILVSGWTSADDYESFVARLTADGDRDATYGTGGVARLKLGSPPSGSSRNYGLTLDQGKAVIAGSLYAGDGVTDLFVARLDESGVLDPTFGDGGVVRGRAGNDDGYYANDVALWNGKLLLAGWRGPAWNMSRNYLLARFDAATGALDPGFNATGTDPGYVFAGAGDGSPHGDALALDAPSGAITVAGSADQDGVTKLMVARYLSDGSRDDAGFRSANGNVGARLIPVGDGVWRSWDRGIKVALDASGKIVVAATAIDQGRKEFALVRLGDTPPKPNLRPVARIRGHHLVPRKHWVKFDGRGSFDRDGRIVDYAWRTGDRPFRSLGPVFWHRFGRPGLHRLDLRVTDDHGARSFAKFFVRVRKRGG